MNYLGEYWNDYWGGYWDYSIDWLSNPREVFRMNTSIASTMPFVSNACTNVSSDAFQVALLISFEIVTINTVVSDRYKELEV